MRRPEGVGVRGDRRCATRGGPSTSSGVMPRRSVRGVFPLAGRIRTSTTAQSMRLDAAAERNAVSKCLGAARRVAALDFERSDATAFCAWNFSHCGRSSRARVGRRRRQRTHGVLTGQTHQGWSKRPVSRVKCSHFAAKSRGLCVVGTTSATVSSAGHQGQGGVTTSDRGTCPATPTAAPSRRPPSASCSARTASGNTSRRPPSRCSQSQRGGCSSRRR